MSEGVKAILIGIFGLGLLIMIGFGLAAITPKATGSSEMCGSASWKYEC